MISTSTASTAAAAAADAASTASVPQQRKRVRPAEDDASVASVEAAKAAKSAAKAAKTASRAKAAAAAAEASSSSDDDDSGSSRSAPDEGTAAARKRTPEQVARANDLNVFRRTLDANIKVLIGQSTTPARPLPSTRFTVDKIDSIATGRYYINPTRMGVPVWIAGQDDPIFINVISPRSAYAKLLPLTFSPDLAEAEGYMAQREIASRLCTPTRDMRHRRSSSASSASAASAASSASAASVAATLPKRAKSIRDTASTAAAAASTEAACLNGHVLTKISKLSKPCCICASPFADMACGDMACRGSSVICHRCVDSVTPNTQAALFIAAAAESADSVFNYDDAITALASTSNGLPIDGRQIAGLTKVATETRDILLRALLHSHNTADSHRDLQLKASALSKEITASDAAIAAAQQRLQQLQHEAAAMKKSHQTLSHMLVCNQARGFGQLPQAAAAAAADDSDSEDSEESDSDDEYAAPPVHKYEFPKASEEDEDD